MAVMTSPRIDNPAWPDRQRAGAVRTLRDLIAAEISAGDFSRGALPSEADLVVRYGTSRGILRDALGLLRRHGLVQRVRGNGTFVVAPARVSHDIDRSQDISHELAGGSARTGWIPLHGDVHPAPPHIARQLGTRVGEPVLNLERITTLDAYPLTLRSSWFAARPFAELLGDDDALHRSFYDVLPSRFGVDLGDTELSVSAECADDVTAPVLGVRPGAALLKMERRLLDGRGRVVEFSTARLRSDRIALTTVMSATALSTTALNANPPGHGPGERTLHE